jgi:hypothetical protein
MPRLVAKACLLFLVALLAAFAGACAGASAPQFDGRVYRDKHIAFELPEVPAGWRRVEIEGASVAFRDDAHAASILVNGRCLASDDRTPLVALTNHLLIGATERRYLLQEVEPFDGREALHTTLEAKWDGVPMAMNVFVLSKDGCIYDFVWFGTREGQATGGRTFEAYVRRFRTLPGSGVVS